ncbi:hypothetical protein HPULCUR_010982 [Helicostylum pulchrum]|uniref:Uncharacterized protein n=1 Tax=Helicostylum pulchrum TaxID=562976 RepID=A0ABP9YET7_9FUNG
MGKGEPFNLEDDREHLSSSATVVIRNLLRSIVEKQTYFKTLVLDLESRNGLPEDNNITKFLLTCRELGQQNFDAGPDRIEEFIAKFQDRLGSPSSSPKPTKRRDDFMASIKSTYLCTPYRSSVDLLMAVSRLLEFTTTVTSLIDWKSSDEIVRAIKRYREFLHITQCSPTIVPVPTIDVDLIWHTHMLHPRNYRQFCTKHLKRIINHDDNIAPEDIEKRIRQFTFAKSHYRRENVEDKASINSKKSKFGIMIRSRSNSSTSLIFPDKTFGGVYSGGDVENTSVEDEPFDKIIDDISYHDRRTVSTFIKLKNSEEAQQKLFELVNCATYTSKLLLTVSAATLDASLRPRIDVQGYPPGDLPYDRVIRTSGPLPIFPEHAMHHLPRYLRSRYKQPQTYSYEEDAPPPAYDADDDASQSCEAQPVRNTEWYKLACIFLLAKQPGMKDTKNATSNDKLPSYGDTNCDFNFTTFSNASTIFKRENMNL